MHVSNKSFHAIEQEVHSCLRISNIRAISAGTQAKMVGNVVTSENVQFYWCMVAYDMTEELAAELLRILIELWITVRSFSFVKSYMELYKQQTKKALQKSKALRKKLNTE